MNENTQVQNTQNNEQAQETKKITVKGVLVGLGMFAAGAAAGAAGMWLYENHKSDSTTTETNAFI